MQQPDKNSSIDPDFTAFHSYSQDGEDMLIRSLIPQFNTDKNYRGFFIDIGAHHPFRFSNTAYFYEKGWQGINIEPTPSAIKLFEQHRTRDINLPVGIGETQEKRTLYCFDDSALNTFDKTIAESYEATPVNTAEIDIYPLNMLLDKHLPAGTKIDFMNIDVAGLDIYLLKSNNWDKYRPVYILVEDVDTYNGVLDASEIHSFLRDAGYEQLVYKTPHTLIYKVK